MYFLSPTDPPSGEPSGMYGDSVGLMRGEGEVGPLGNGQSLFREVYACGQGSRIAF